VPEFEREVVGGRQYTHLARIRSQTSSLTSRARRRGHLDGGLLLAYAFAAQRYPRVKADNELDLLQ